MLYMVIERFRGGDAVPVYHRLRERGRSLPDRVRYVASWVTSDLTRCYQVMECMNRRDLDVWLDEWSDLVEFEVLPVVTSGEAETRIAPRL